MKAFTFEKALMQEHFNEKYIESHKFPKSTFKGKILDFNKSSLTDKTREVMIRGTLTIHGISKEISVKGTLEKTKGGISGRSVFNINIKDYNIKVPSAVRKNIADTIEINVNMNYEKMD
jgi:polyisoprenoid-binding protein YceI